MTSTQDLIARAVREIETKPGYNYSRAVLEEVISAGVLPDGTVFMRQNGIDLTYFAEEVRYIKDGTVIKTMPVTEQVSEAALIVRAKAMARRGSCVGGF